METTQSHKRTAEQLSWWYQDPRKRRCERIARLEQDLSSWLEACFGHYSVEFSMLNFERDWFATPAIHKRFFFGSAPPAVVTDFENLPIDSESIDFVSAVHVLEFIKQPHQFLREVDRILVPEGNLLIVSMNPLGWQGIQRAVQRLFWINQQLAPWCGNFYTLHRIKDWLSVLGFELVAIHHALSPLLREQGIHQYLKPVLEQFPLFCSLSVLCACKRVASPQQVGQSWVRPIFFKKGVAPQANREGT